MISSSLSIRRATVDELVRIVVAAFRKLSSLPAIAKTRRSSQETRSNHAGPTGRSKFAAGRCDILAMSSTPGSCILLVSIILYQQKAHGYAIRRGGCRRQEGLVCAVSEE